MTDVRVPAGKWPQLWDSSFSSRKAILDNAFNVVVTEQLLDDGPTSNPAATSSNTGELTLDFELPANDPKASLILNEMCILVAYPAAVGGQTQDVFVVRTIQTGTESGYRVYKVHAEGRWYDLGAADEIVVTPAVTNPTSAMNTILANTGWTVGTVQPAGGSNYTFEIDTYCTPLAALRALPGVFGGELVFDTVNRKVSLVNQRGSASVVAMYARGSNIVDDSRIVDTTQLTTRAYPIGSGGVDITTVNGGVGYIEDYSWFDANSMPRQIRAQDVTNDSLSDPSLLLSWGRTQLQMLAQPRVTYTVTPALLVTDIVPGLGDVVRVHDTTIALDTNSRVVQRALNLLKPFLSTIQINTSAFTISNSLPGTPRQPVVPVSNLDKMPPAAPGAITTTANDVIDGNGNHVEYLHFTWGAVTTNADGSPCVDLDHYYVRYRIGTTNANPWISAGTTTVTAIGSGPMPPGQYFSVEVYAVDKFGNESSPATSQGLTPGVPVSNLNPPYPPILDTTTFPLTIRATWNGEDNVAGSYPANLDHIEVHLGSSSTFTPSNSTLVDALKTAGVSPITGLTAGTTYWVKFVAVDTAGIRSAASNGVSGIPSNVQDGQIDHLSIGKLLVGSLTADMTVSARIKTANSGARVELNSSGFYAYDAGNNQTVGISSADGSASFTGTVKTVGPGGAYIEMLSTTNISGTNTPILQLDPIASPSGYSPPQLYSYVDNNQNGWSVYLQSGYYSNYHSASVRVANATPDGLRPSEAELAGDVVYITGLTPGSGVQLSVSDITDTQAVFVGGVVATITTANSLVTLAQTGTLYNPSGSQFYKITGYISGMSTTAAAQVLRTIYQLYDVTNGVIIAYGFKWSEVAANNTGAGYTIVGRYKPTGPWVCALRCEVSQSGYTTKIGGTSQGEGVLLTVEALPGKGNWS